MATKKNVTKEVAAVVEKEVVKKTTAKKEVAKENSKKVSKSVPQMTNDELRQLFVENGCVAGSKAKADTVVYNQFGTKSRVLQQGKAYQLLLTNGHKEVKGAIVDTDNDDAKRFEDWYNQLSKEDQEMVVGFAEMMNTKLSASEMPRERSVKLTSKDLLVKFIQYMATFTENKPQAVVEA